MNSSFIQLEYDIMHVTLPLFLVPESFISLSVGRRLKMTWTRLQCIKNAQSIPRPDRVMKRFAFEERSPVHGLFSHWQWFTQPFTSTFNLRLETIV
jgi:hypothetical protein